MIFRTTSKKPQLFFKKIDYQFFVILFIIWISKKQKLYSSRFLIIKYTNIAQ